MKRIIVEEIDGIVIPDTVKRPMQKDWFEVLAVGDGVEDKEIQVGRKVFSEGYANFAIEDNVELFLAREIQILAFEG